MCGRIYISIIIINFFFFFFFFVTELGGPSGFGRLQNWTSGPNPLAKMDPPGSNPLPDMEPRGSPRKNLRYH